MGKGEKKTKESSLYTFFMGIIQQYSLWLLQVSLALLQHL